MTKEIILEDNLIRKNKIPVLIQDKEWKALFEKHMTKTMKKIAEELELKGSEEKQAIVQMKLLKKCKKDLMEKVLHLSDALNRNQNQEALMKLEETKKEILQINQEMDDLQYKLEILPKQINQLNLMLLKETILVAYKDIKEGSQRAKDLGEEILRLRQQLADCWEEKINLEKRTETIYAYLHNTLGYEETDKLDKKFL